MNRKQRRAAPAAPDLPRTIGELFETAARHTQAGRVSQAISCFRKAVALAPGFPAAHYNLGNALVEHNQHAEAAISFRNAIGLAPTLAEAHSNLGAALKQLGGLDEAARHCREAIALAPNFPLGHFNLGAIFEEQRDLEQAVASYRNATRLAPNFAEAHLNLAMMLLALGDFPAGWQEHEWRWKTSLMRPGAGNLLQPNWNIASTLPGAHNLPRPQWRGETLPGKTLLIHAEQGFGDTIQFCRYAPLASARGLRVILQAPAPLLRLLQSLPGIGEFIPEGAPLPPFDVHIPMMSLPLAIGTTLETIPALSPYLQAAASDIEAWSARFAAYPAGIPRIGLVWAGNSYQGSPKLQAVDRRRSIGLDRFTPFLDCPNLNFFSLQKNQQPSGSFPIIDLMQQVRDFADTAALIANLDLVISVDTAVAHLAAALGKPVWLLNRFTSDWRWMSNRRDSLWYPTMRLYNQKTPDDWGPVIAQAAADLRLLSASRLPEAG